MLTIEEAVAKLSRAKVFSVLRCVHTSGLGLDLDSQSLSVNASGLDLDWIWTQFGQDLSPPNRGGLGKNSDRTQANVNAIGLTSDWKWTGCHGEVVVHCTSGQQCAPVNKKLTGGGGMYICTANIYLYGKGRNCLRSWWYVR